MERRILPQALSRVLLEKRVGTDTPLIVGFASVFYRADDPGTEFTLWDFGDGDKCVERIMPTAFDQVLADGVDCFGLFNHDPNYVLGRVGNGTLKLTKEAAGLRYTIAPPDAPLAQGVVANIKREDVTGSSFAFQVERAGERWIEQGGLVVREIHAVSMLRDVGPVTFPAYPATSTSMRAAVGDGVGEDPRKVYDHWKQTMRPAASPELLERLAFYRSIADDAGRHVAS